MALLLALAGCSGEDPRERPWTLVVPEDGDEIASVRVRAFDMFLVCITEDPDRGEPANPPALREATWDDPLETSAPPLVVPKEEDISLVVEGANADGDVLFWGCDDDVDGVLRVVLERTCTSLQADPPACDPDGLCPTGEVGCFAEDGTPALDGEIKCHPMCECTPGTIVDFDTCQCCSDAGLAETCEQPCLDTCAGRRTICPSMDCPRGTGYCIGDVAHCSPPDTDGDGYTDCFPIPPATEIDCNDAIFTVNPSAPEICDGVDDDCDVATPDGSEGDCAALGRLAVCADGACRCGDDTCTRDDDYCCTNGCLTAEEVAVEGCVDR